MGEKKEVTELKEILEKQHHKGPQEVTCKLVTPKHHTKMKSIISNPLKI